MNKINNTQINAKICDDGIKISLRVLPNASKCEISGIIESSLRVKLDVPPIDGKANEKCIKFLSKIFKVSKSSMQIVSGEKNKNKILYIKGDVQDLIKKLNEILSPM